MYRYVLTGADKATDAWPNIFLVFTLCIHAIFVFETIALVRTGALWHLPNKTIAITVIALLMALSFWHYVWRGKGKRVVEAYEKLGNYPKYARIGAIFWYEMLILPFLFAAVLIISQKLTGWPPHP